MLKIMGIKIKAKEIDQVCPIHNVHLVTAVNLNSEPFCKMCVAEKMEQEKKELVQNFKKDNITSYLTDVSLVAKKSDYTKTFSNFKADRGSKEAEMGNSAYKIAQDYIKNPDKPIKALMYGTPGEGKTHLAMAILNKINGEANPPQRCLFIDINILFEKVKRSIGDSTEDWDRFTAIRRLSKADVLVLDDLGSESSMQADVNEATDFIQKLLKPVFDSQERIIITTNLTFEQLQRVYNPKLVSRLLEYSNGRRLNFGGIKDKRLLK